jgi:hypothetical protein
MPTPPLRPDTADRQEPARTGTSDPRRERRQAEGISVWMVVLVATVFAIVGVLDAIVAHPVSGWSAATAVITSVVWLAVMIALVVWATRRRRRGAPPRAT